MALFELHLPPNYVILLSDKATFVNKLMKIIKPLSSSEKAINNPLSPAAHHKNYKTVILENNITQRGLKRHFFIFPIYKIITYSLESLLPRKKNSAEQ